ncbi:MAG: glucokinase [Pseudomonadota bacterium]
MVTTLVGDFGGTNARLALSTEEGITGVREFKCSDFPDPSAIVNSYIGTRDVEKIDHGVFAVAGASEDPENVTFTNGPWAQRGVNFTNCEIDVVETINDFEAICYSISALKPEDTLKIVAGTQPFFPSLYLADEKTYTDNPTRLIKSSPEKRFVVLGPGTGLGVSTGLVTDGGQFLVVGGEGGHSDFSPSTDDELYLKEYLESIDKIVSLETIASGTGLATVFNARCDMLDIPTRIQDASELEAQMREGKPKEVRQAARWTLKLFAKTLGKCAATVTLSSDSRTVFLTGGVVPKLGLTRNLYVNAFTSAFHNNDLGENNTLKQTPVALITHQQPGLLGASAYGKLARG